MITEYMTADEVFEYTKEDRKDLLACAGFAQWRAEIRKLGIKKYPKGVVKPHTFKSRHTGQNYLVYLEYVPGKAWLGSGRYSMYAPVQTDHGKLFFNIFDEEERKSDEYPQVLTEHFLIRYAERTGLHATEPSTILLQFMQRDSNFFMVYENKKKAVYACRSGIIFAEEKRGWAFQKTFVSESMLHDSQHEVWERAQLLLDRYESDALPNEEYRNSMREASNLLLHICQPIYDQFFQNGKDNS